VHARLALDGDSHVLSIRRQLDVAVVTDPTKNGEALATPIYPCQLRPNDGRLGLKSGGSDRRGEENEQE
jgi:hypothetical protein